MRSSPILVRLRGGFGNQMFQYAFGRALALRHNRELWLDPTLLERSQATVRPYALADFQLPVHLGVLAQLGHSPGLVVVLRQAGRGFLSEARDFLPPVGALVLDGYWQSEAYFSAFTDQIRLDFGGAKAPTTAGAVSQAIAATNAVAVHVRRGDYLDPTRSHMLALPSAYYRKAADRLVEEVRHPHFFVFSDDITWCRDHLEWPGPHILVSGEDAGRADPLPEFLLMVGCRHFIVANSTFSWWAAWLGRWPERRVIAPARWFPDDPAGDRAILPANWGLL